MYIEIPDDHKDPKDSQLIVAITGTPEYIRMRLQYLLEEALKWDKPSQGTSISATGTTSVQTDIWRQVHQ